VDGGSESTEGRGPSRREKDLEVEPNWDRKTG